MKEKDLEKVLYELELREDMIPSALKELQESEVTRKAAQFKDEALEVLKTHLDHQKKLLIPDVEVFTGTPRAAHRPRQVRGPQAAQGEIPDFIDFTTPEKKPKKKEPKTPDGLPMLDFLAFEGIKSPYITPTLARTRRRLDVNSTPTEEPNYIDLLDTTPPVLIMGRAPLQPQKTDWWDNTVDLNDIEPPLRPGSVEKEKPLKSFMETASDWIKYAQVHLSQRDTRAGYELWADILTAPSQTEPISEPVMPKDWEISDEDEILIEGL